MNPFRISSNEALCDLGKLEYKVNGSITDSGAFVLSDKVSLQLKIPRSIGTMSANMLVYDEYGCDLITSVPLNFSDIVSSFDIYTCDISPESLGVGIYFASLSIKSVIGEIYAFQSRGEIYFKEAEKQMAPKIQFSVSDFKYAPPERLWGGFIYHIFVDRFNKSDKLNIQNRAEYVKDWYSEIPEYPEYPGAPLRNIYTYGGDLYGIIAKLHYLKSLGVTHIYLSPIFKSPSNHKYDTADYMTVDETFGGREALKALIDSARKLGIYIILDGVFNHTGADSVYFNKFGTYDSLGAYQSKKSPYYSWYDFKSFPDEYTSWWGIEILPRIDTSKRSCRDFFVGDGGVIEEYSKLGIEGFRLDVADELSDSFISSVKKVLNKFNRRSILIGEVWEDASNKIAYGKRKHYYLGGELDAVMNYTVRRGIISYIRDKDTDELKYALTEVINNTPSRILHSQMNLIGSHDTERILTSLGGIKPDGKTNKELCSIRMTRKEYQTAKKRLLSAFTVLMTLPGVPSVYYGDEAGMEGYSDPFNRRAYPWGKEDGDIISHVSKLGSIRHLNAVYRDGDFKLIALTKDLLVFKRFLKGKSCITVINNSEHDITLMFSCEAKELLTSSKNSKFTLYSGDCAIYGTSNENILEII